MFAFQTRPISTIALIVILVGLAFVFIPGKAAMPFLFFFIGLLLTNIGVITGR
jgi:hypothetical protein